MTTLKVACICLFLLMLANTKTYSQVQKGDKNLGFGFDMNSLSGDTEETRSNLFLTYTHYISNRISIGFGPRIGWTKDASDSKSTTTGYNGFLNYSFLTSGGFVLPYFGFQYTNLRQKQAGDDDPLVTTSVGGNFGLRFFLTERFNIDNNLSYTRIISGNDTLDELGIDADGTVIQINVGLGYIIGRKN